MDTYLERYFDATMDAQVTRNGIFARRRLSDRFRGWFGMK